MSMPADTIDNDLANLNEVAQPKMTLEQLTRDAIDRIMTETNCSWFQAVSTIEFIEALTNQARNENRQSYDEPGVYHLTEDEMKTAEYGIMDRIMPHGEFATEDSAHAAVQQLVLNGDEYALTHDNPTGKPEDCVVCVRVSSI